MTTEAPLIGDIDKNFFGRENFTQIYNSFQKITFLTNPLSHLADTTLVIVICKKPCFTCCRAVCPYKDYYSTVIRTNEGWQYLFNNVLSIGCTLCPAGLYCRWKGCESKIVSSAQDIEQNEGTSFANMIKDKACSLGDCCDKYFLVNDFQEEKTHGIIKLRGICDRCSKCKCCKCKCILCQCGECLCNKDCHDYFLACDILNQGKEIKYSIFLQKCCCDCCYDGKCSPIKYAIKNNSGMTVGRIEGYPNCLECNYVYKIRLSDEASPEIKLTIINAIFVIDALGLH